MVVVWGQGYVRFLTLFLGYLYGLHCERDAE